MKICFPVQKNEGMSSLVYGHFGSAPIFLVLDTETNAVAAIKAAQRITVHIPYVID